MPDLAVVWKMAFDAFLAAMPGIVKPVLVFRLHDVTTGTEFGRSGPGVKPGRAEADETAQGHRGQDQESEFLETPYFSPAAEHFSHGRIPLGVRVKGYRIAKPESD